MADVTSLFFKFRNKLLEDFFFLNAKDYMTNVYTQLLNPDLSGSGSIFIEVPVQAEKNTEVWKYTIL